ncbi:MAG: hypothetical protein NUV94_02110 [Candidatus Acetothermia bacterium]|jgi:hypothetical protein|nr:hypothetical protein [Candidatus Acetothermia bacterium]
MTARPGTLLLVGVMAMVLAVVLAFLMFLKVLAPSLALGFLSFTLSVGGLILGLIGATSYFRPSGRDGDE